MWTRTRWQLSLVLVAFSLVSGSTVHAQPAQHGREQAEPIVMRGMDQFSRRDFAGALASFEEAYKLYPSGKIFYNIGLALDELGKPAEAANAYQRFLEHATEAPAAATQHAKERLLALDAALGGLRVTATPEGAAIAIDGAPIGAPPITIVRVVPGTHRVTASRTGHLPAEQMVDVKPNTTATVDLVLAGEPTKPIVVATPMTPSTVQADPEAATDDASPGALRWTWVAGAGAVASLGIATVYGLKARSSYDAFVDATTGEDYDELRSRVRRQALTANVCFGASALLAVATVLLFVHERGDRRGASSSRSSSAAVRRSLQSAFMLEPHDRGLVTSWVTELW